MHRLWPTMNYYFIIVTRRGKKKEKRRRWRLLERRGERERERPATALLNCNVLGAHTVVCGGHSQIFGLRRARECYLLPDALSCTLSPGPGKKKGRFLQITERIKLRK
jgi:hypothetical protein